MMDRQWMGRMLSYAHKEKLWRRGSRILAAVSGGPDSLGLLLFLDSIREEEGIEVGCCCVDHHLRKESGEEADYVGKICLERKIPFYRRDVDVKGAQKGGESIETIARDLRYKALRDVKEKEHYDVIATAHHADDQAETVLFHFLRGSGAKGLSGISPKGMTSSVRSSAQGKRKSRISSKISLMSLAMIRRMTFPTSQGTSSGFF